MVGQFAFVAGRCDHATRPVLHVCERKSRYGLPEVKIGEASNPGPPKLSRQRSRNRGGDTLVFSDEERLVPCSRNSVACTRSTPSPQRRLVDAFEFDLTRYDSSEASQSNTVAPISHDDGD